MRTRKRSTRSGAGVDWLWNALSVERKVFRLHSTHIHCSLKKKKKTLQTAPWQFLSFFRNFCECCPVDACNKIKCNTDHGLVKLSQGCLCKKVHTLDRGMDHIQFQQLASIAWSYACRFKRVFKVKVKVKDRVQSQNWINITWVIGYTNILSEKKVSLFVRPSRVHLWYLWCLFFTWQTDCTVRLMKTDQLFLYYIIMILLYYWRLLIVLIILKVHFICFLM